MRDRAKSEQIDKTSTSKRARSFLKKLKARSERRRAKKNPACAPAYNRYDGYY